MTLTPVFVCAVVWIMEVKEARTCTSGCCPSAFLNITDNLRLKLQSDTASFVVSTHAMSRFEFSRPTSPFGKRRATSRPSESSPTRTGAGRIETSLLSVASSPKGRSSTDEAQRRSFDGLRANRPETPLDFFFQKDSRPSDIPALKQDTSSPRKSVELGSHRRTTSFADASLRVPKGQTFGLPEEESRPQSPPNTRRVPSSADNTPSRRLANNIRGTKEKLASLGRFAKPREAPLFPIPAPSAFPKQPIQSGHGTRITATPSSLPERSSSLALGMPRPDVVSTGLVADQGGYPLAPTKSLASESTSTSALGGLPEMTDSTGCSTNEEFAHLFTPAQSSDTTPADLSQLYAYAPSLTSTHSSTSNRDRVMGNRDKPGEGYNPAQFAGASRVFLPPKRSDVLPFASGHPFSAWESIPTKQDGQKGLVGSGRHGRRPSVRLSKMDMRREASLGEVKEGWKETSSSRGDARGKKIWTVDDVGVGKVYRVGWEREVLDL